MSALVTLLVGGGGVTLITKLVRGIASTRAGARASTKAVLQDLAEDRDDKVERNRALERDNEFWRNAAGSYAYQMVKAGMTPEPPTLVPPSELERRKSEVTRRRREPDIHT